jgi:membrane-bound serine protease (ClpP class)
MKLLQPSTATTIRPVLGFLAAILVCLQTQSLARGQATKPAASYQHGVVIRLQGPITPMLEQFLLRKLEAAKKQNADLLVVEIDSPGGFLDSSLNMAERLRDLRWARTVAFISREALSGAAITALACDDIVMTPLARLGDAGPIMQGEDSLFRHAPEKIRSELVGRLRDLGKAKGRPPALAAAMADMDLVVYRVRNKQTGEEDFLADEDIANAANPADWEKLQAVPESRPKYFLSVNGERAVQLRLAQAVADNLEDVRERYGVQREFTILQATPVDTAVTILNWPVITGLLFVVGLVALYIEFSAPGVGMGGLIAGLCFALFFWSRFLGGTADWLEVILFAAGLVFLAMEVFVIPGFGVAGLTGVLLVFVSVLMASQHFVFPRTALQLNTSLQSVLVLATSGLVFLGAAAVLSRYFRLLPVVNSLMLETPDAYALAESSTGKDEKARTHDVFRRVPVQVGDWGLADSPLRPAGKARFGEHHVDVVADGVFVDKGKSIRVIEVSGNRVVVREVAEDA